MKIDLGNNVINQLNNIAWDLYSFIDPYMDIEYPEYSILRLKLLNLVRTNDLYVIEDVLWQYFK